MIATTIHAAGFAQPILELDTCWQASRENQHRILVMKLALSEPVRFISCMNVVSYGCRPRQILSLNEITTSKIVQNYRQRFYKSRCTRIDLCSRVCFNFDELTLAVLRRR